MKLYSYVMIADNSFAPNPLIIIVPLHKPKIRKNADIVDWVT